MSSLLRLFVLFLVAASVFAGPPNMIFFIADDVSVDDIGCYGHRSIHTPNIDALAGSGMRFDQAYLTISSCSPSRCSIISARYPHNTGAPELHSKLPEAQIRFPELLREAGYHTALSGKNHMFSNKDRAFDVINRGSGPGGEGEWASLVEKRPKDKPFFFWFAAFDAHRSWQVNEDAPTYKNEAIEVPPYLVDDEATRGDLAKYYHEVSRFDHFIGEVVGVLKKQRVLEDTLIVVAADNGRPFPRCKSRLYESGIQTPWVVHYPAIVKKAAITQSLVSSIDLGATCLELAGLPAHPALQGQSFLPILKDPTATVREVVFAEQNWHVYRNHSRMVRFGDVLYIWNGIPDQMNLCYESHQDPAGASLWTAQAAGKTTAAQQGLFMNPCPVDELYDVSKDPHQLHNLAADPAYAKQLAEARGLLETWKEQTGDSMPASLTPNRHPPPRIQGGKVIPADKSAGQNKSPHKEFAGASKGAAAIQHPGPLRRK